MDTDEDKAENIAMKARNSISSYCSSECKAYCCRKGYLLMTSKEKDLVVNNHNNELNDNGCLIKTEKGEYSLDLDSAHQGCPSLDGNKCKIHKNPDRPKACKEFPLFLWDNKMIRMSERCPAVRADLFYPFIAEFKLMGYNVSYD